MTNTLGMEEQLPNLLLKALGRRIRELRTEQGYSQEAFADKCGVHRTFMGTIERGESNLSFQNILKVAINLGVSLSTLFQGLEKCATEQAVQAESSKQKATAKGSKLH